MGIAADIAQALHLAEAEGRPQRIRIAFGALDELAADPEAQPHLGINHSPDLTFQGVSLIPAPPAECPRFEVEHDSCWERRAASG